MQALADAILYTSLDVAIATQLSHVIGKLIVISNQLDLLLRK